MTYKRNDRIVYEYATGTKVYGSILGKAEMPTTADRTDLAGFWRVALRDVRGEYRATVHESQLTPVRANRR